MGIPWAAWSPESERLAKEYWDRMEKAGYAPRIVESFSVEDIEYDESPLELEHSRIYREGRSIESRIQDESGDTDYDRSG